MAGRQSPWLALCAAFALSCGSTSASPLASLDAGGTPSSGGSGVGGNNAGGSGGSHAGTSGGTAGAAGTSSLAGAAGAGANTGGVDGSAGMGASGGVGAVGGGLGGSGASGTSGAGGTGTSGAGAAGASTGGAAGMTGIAIPGAGKCSAPSGANAADASAAYAKWKTDLLTSDGAGGFLRVRRPNSNGAEVNSTVSEGIAYGMLLAVYASDQPTFDKLWQYSKLWPDSHGLMNWYINAAGTQALGSGGATDADEDMAFALVMADARWGGSGSLSTGYLSLAKSQMDLVWQYEVDHGRNDVLMPGDQFADGSIINISYFAPAYYRVFGRISGNATEWNSVMNTSYTVLAQTLNTTNGNTQNGLVPAWSTPAGVPSAPAGQTQTFHQLDSCRTPFRLGEDYCWNAEPRALAYLQKIAGFYASIGVAALVDGYDLDGTPHPQFVTSGGPRAASFVGPAGVAAMATGASFLGLRDDAYAGVAGLGELAGSTYYQESWTALSLQMMTGQLGDLSAP
ncbi:MAG TPA: glycosyl hydrolase family 8 [Polyangiaceae bacterium]